MLKFASLLFSLFIVFYVSSVSFNAVGVLVAAAVIIGAVLFVNAVLFDQTIFFAPIV